ncbi:MAG: hypothetical protein A2V69_02700 [Candidatus Portnoybacteria bacterium RBG_13_40_8]|uniref:Uncharacterized protein n=1 Tax=Candidatus Portnoybacteria bacterium RBG_13_40_8 TaxID=1801990 RepID=A0A1G2F465_9BACT|nr:MAG: hypothetical protein A2V69_02700 [Candidatus Portnoybacteria bacterium RBG_13_40_8]OGZ35470.1 MAG: hypothetical protein A2V60_03475 [Candidatus Portnoybacteria bacterium RIFCSPHIGHO2_01_FULL_39_19]
MSRFLIAGMVLMVLVMNFGCKTETQELWGTVEDVRTTSAVTQKTEGKGDPVGGAIFGALAAGTTGAIVGAAVENRQGKIVVSEELLGCKFVVKLDNGTRLDFTIEESLTDNNCTKCSLLRKGDRIKVVETVYATDKKRSVSYSWPNDYRGESGQILH